MNEKAENLLNELVSKIGTREEFEQIQKQLFKRGIESLLSAELTAHLGHEKGSKPTSDNVRNGHSEKIFESDLNKRDTFDIPDMFESYSSCNRIELGEYQNHSLSFVMKPRKCRAKSNYCNISMKFVKDIDKEACVKYFIVFDCGVGPREISKDKEKQIQLKDGSSCTAVFFETHTGDPDYSDYSSDIESFYWSKKHGLVRYTTLFGETFDLVKYVD